MGVLSRQSAITNVKPMDTEEQDFAARLANEFIDCLEVGLWVYDIDKKRVVWANAAALSIWQAETLDELRSRDLSLDMSPAVDERLRQYKEDFERNKSTFTELWTLYPGGRPTTVKVKYRGFPLQDGRMAMLCEANQEARTTPEVLRSSEALLHTSVMITLLDTEGNLLYCNPAARARYGSSCMQVGQRFFRKQEGDELMQEIAEHRMCQRIAQVETIQGTRWHDITGFSCHDAVTGDKAVLLSEVDVTRTQEAQAALAQSRNEALEATRLKSEFLANMSHEIRTPLNGVLGMAQLLESTELTPLQRRYTQTVRSSGASLLAIIDDVLDISRIEAGLVQIEREVFCISDVVQQTIETVTGVVMSKGLTIRKNCDLPQGVMHVGDPRRLKQVLINLAGNAVKFTERGQVVISVKSASPGHVRFEVRDTGPGVPVNQQISIFERFRQADGSNVRKHGGTGLGLAICSSLVELMGGQIGVESTPGLGATFWFELPMPPHNEKICEARPERACEMTKDIQGQKRKRVLLVEDNGVNQFLVREALHPRGFDVTMAENGHEAIEALQKTRFDLVIMDLHMPIMSGEEAIASIRSSKASYRDVPILVFTANAMSWAEDACLRLGANGYLTKPVDIERLVHEVQDHVQPQLDPGGLPSSRQIRS